MLVCFGLLAGLLAYLFFFGTGQGDECKETTRQKNDKNNLHKGMVAQFVPICLTRTGAKSNFWF